MYHMIRYDSYYMHLYIKQFMSTYNTSLWYEIFCTQYDTYHVSDDTDNYGMEYFEAIKRKSIHFYS